MDFAVFGATDTPPCDEPSEEQVGGYDLCRGCAEALETLDLLGTGLRESERKRT